MSIMSIIFLLINLVLNAKPEDNQQVDIARLTALLQEQTERINLLTDQNKELSEIVKKQKTDDISKIIDEERLWLPHSADDLKIFEDLSACRIKCRSVNCVCTANNPCLTKTYNALRDILDRNPEWSPPSPREISDKKDSINNVLKTLLRSLVVIPGAVSTTLLQWRLDDKLKHLLVFTGETNDESFKNKPLQSDICKLFVLFVPNEIEAKNAVQFVMEGGQKGLLVAVYTIFKEKVLNDSFPDQLQLRQQMAHSEKNVVADQSLQQIAATLEYNINFWPISYERKAKIIDVVRRIVLQNLDLRSELRSVFSQQTISVQTPENRRLLILFKQLASLILDGWQFSVEAIFTEISTLEEYVSLWERVKMNHPALQTPIFAAQNGFSLSSYPPVVNLYPQQTQGYMIQNPAMQQSITYNQQTPVIEEASDSQVQSYGQGYGKR